MRDPAPTCGVLVHARRSFACPLSRSQAAAPVGRRRCAAQPSPAALIAGTGTVAASAVAAPTPMVDLGTASTYAVLSGASVGNTVSAAGAPHTTLRGDLGVKANTQPTGFPPGVGHRREPTSATRPPPRPTPTSSRRTPRSPPAPAAPRSPARWPARRSRRACTPIAGAASNTTTVTLDARRQPERRLRLSGQRRPGVRRRQPGRADRRRPGVAGLLAGQRRRRRRRATPTSPAR